MDPEMASSLAEEMHVSEDLALMAVQEAEGELEKARDILNDLLPKYLSIKAKFMSSRSGGICGLVFIIIKKRAGNFLIFRTLSDGSRDWVSTVRVHRDPEMFFRTIKDYFNARSTSLLLFDAQKLKDGIQSRLSSASLQYLFELWDEPKTEIVPESAPTEAFMKPGEILHSTFQTVLEDILVDRVALELDYDFFTETQFEPMKVGLGLVVPKKEPQKLTEEESAGLKVYLKGQFIIDPIYGTLVYELRTGDLVYFEITDRSEVAVSVGRLLGAYKRGLWLPIKGRISEMYDATGGCKKFRLKAAQGIFIDVLSIGNVKVRTMNLTSRERVANAIEEKADTSMIPILVAVSLLAFLIVVLMMMR